MKVSKEILSKMGVLPKLRLGKKKSGGGTISTGAHRVKLLSDKIVNGTDPKTGKIIEFVRYLVEEKGEKKIYQTKKLNDKGEVNYLVMNLSEINEGDEVILEMKKQGIKNYIEVLPVKGSLTSEVEDGEEDNEDNPTVEEIAELFGGKEELKKEGVSIKKLIN